MRDILRLQRFVLWMIALVERQYQTERGCLLHLALHMNGAEIVIALDFLAA